MPEQVSITMQSQPVQIPAAALPVAEGLQEEADFEILQPLLIQRKLSVGAADDPLENEADSMAEQVMQMPQQSFIQRANGCHAKEETLLKKPLASFIQRKETAGKAEAGEGVAKRIEASAGNGESLSGSAKSFMENRFGTEFSKVRIHTGTYASQLSRQLNAEAFTTGNDIYFNEGKYQPDTQQGQSLLAHELTHVVQQQSETSSHRIQRRIIRGPVSDDGLLPVVSNATTIAGFAADGISIIRPDHLSTYGSIIVFTQNGLDVYNISQSRFVAHYAKRQGEGWPEPSLWHIDLAGGVDQIGFRNGQVVTEGRAFEVDIFTPPTQIVIRRRGAINFLEDMTMTTAAELNSHHYLPAVIVIGTLPAGSGSGTGTGEGPHVEDWAQSQTQQLSQSLGLGAGGRTGTGTGTGASTGAPGGESTNAPDATPSLRDTHTDSQRPDRLVVWARADGRQFVNVWVGGQNRQDGGLSEAVELHEGETPEQLKERVQQTTERVRQRLSDNAVNAENRLTQGGVPYNDSTFHGSEGNGQRANSPSYRATMGGPEVMVRNGTGAYSMSLHYEDIYPDLLGQVSAAFNGSDYVWQTINITPLYQQVMQERSDAIQHTREQLARGETPTPTGPGQADQRLTQQGNTDALGTFHTVSHSEADLRDLNRRYHNFTEDASQAWSDLANPISSQDGSSGSAIRSVLVNSFNLATLPLHAILSLGGWVVRALSGIFSSDPAYQQEIPFPDYDGYFLVRCVAMPRTIGEGEHTIRRMPSVAVKVVEVKEIQARTRQELESQDLNLESSILELLLGYRTTTEESQRLNLRQMLEMKVQEAAQTHRSFLIAEKTSREQDLENRRRQRQSAGNTEPDAVESRIAEEIEILGHGTTTGSGLVSDIITRQITIKQHELEVAERAGNPYTIRDIRNQITQLQNRLETAQLREGEMQDEGQAIVRPQAIFVNEEDGQSIPVLIEIGQVHHSFTNGYTMRLSDITGTSSDEHDQDGRTRADAVRHTITEYAGHFPYGRGYLTVRFPAGMNFGITEPIIVRCNPRDTAQASERLDELMQVLAIVGLFIPGVGVAVAAVGAAVSAARIMNRIMNHTFQWDSATIMDGLNIIGAVASGVTRITGGRLITAQRMFAIVPESEDMAAWVTRLSRFHAVAEFFDSTVNNVSYLLGSMETVTNYLDIQRQEMSGGLTHAEARRRRASLMVEAMNNQIMQHAPGIIEHFRPDGTAVHHQEGEENTPPHPHDTTLPPPEHPSGGTHEENPVHPHEEDEQHHGGGGGTPHPAPEEIHAGTPTERVTRFLNERSNVLALLRRNPPGTIERLLRLHGNWRDLVMFLQSQPHNEIFQYLVDELHVMRDGVVADLERDFQLRLSDPNASTHASSDIDLATTGTDAGARMNRAEAYMRERFGRNWSELLRMNFYTEAERLFMYEQVRPHMSDEAFGQLQGRISHLAEILNFAKMLQHADGNSQSIARVEQLMAHLSPEQQAAARSRAAEPPAQAAARAQDLHTTIDNLATRFEALRHLTGTALPAAAIGTLPPSLPAHLREAINRAVTPEELQVALASAISELQMEANFRTTEAYISPGANRQVVRGVAVRGHEAYQSAMSHLEMMEHVIHQAGGNVETAAREYELYKYIDRFIVAMQLAGLRPDSFMLGYYQAAHDLYKNNRTAVQGVGRHDMNYLLAMHNQFVSEAASVLPQMRDMATQNPAEWNETHRSLQADATSIRDTSTQRERTNPQTPATQTPSANLGTVGSLLEAGRGTVSIAHVPVERNNSLPGNETRARFVNGRLILELGPHAGHEQLRQHLDTLRVLQRYEGTLGLVRQLFSQIGELLGMGPGFGSRGHEARQEVTKLLGIRADLETQRTAIEVAMSRVGDNGTLAVLQENYSNLLSEISRIESQVQLHERDVNSTQAARGHVAMANTAPPASPVLTQANPRFGVEPNVGESVRYRDRGGTEGTVSRLTSTTLAIITRLGQSTVRANYQSRLGPADVNLPSGRHGFEALHAIGPGVGHESPYGIYFGPWRLNQLIQRVGIERFIGDVGDHLRHGKQVMLRVEVEKVTMPVVQADGTTLQVDFLKSITYQLYGNAISHQNKLFELSIGVTSPNDPVSAVEYDAGSIFFSNTINEYTDMTRVSASFEPEFSATDPIDE